MFKEIKQSFVIRIKNNIILSQSRKLKSFTEENSSVVQDITCYLGTKTKKFERNLVILVRCLEGASSAMSEILPL